MFKLSMAFLSSCLLLEHWSCSLALGCGWLGNGNGWLESRQLIER
jgi:hypothetical protein